MRKSKHYQVIADSLKTVRKSLGIKPFTIDGNDRDFEYQQSHLFDLIINQLCYDLEKENQRFKRDIFVDEIWKD